MNRRFFSTEAPIKYEFNLKKQRTMDKKRGAEGGTKRAKERGVYVSCSANKQKVNTGEGNTVTLDAAERIPLRFPRRPFLLATGQKQRRKKSQHLSPPEALGDNGQREKKPRNTFCLPRFKHAAFFRSDFHLFLVAPPRRFLYGATTHRWQRVAPSPLLAAH